MKYAIAVLLLVALSACASRSVLPEADEVNVGRETPDASKCHELGKLTGSTPSVHGTPEDALKDLKREAANKGANYVVVKEYSAYGTAVTGIAYECK